VFEVHNHGPLILRTNYWELDAAKAGKFLVSLNAGAFRLLVPPQQEGFVSEMATAKGVAVCRGPSPPLGFGDGFNLLFDDGSDDPFVLELAPAAFDRLPTAENVTGEWVFTAWTRPRRGDRPHKALERPCRYRLSPRLPDLRPWEER
jgi:hypothetical protein